MKFFFTPFSVVAGLLAGVAASKLFEFIWSRFDDEQAPDPKHRETDWRKLIAAMAVEGAIARIVRGSADHGMRVAFARTTGTWPGDEEPDAT